MDKLTPHITSNRLEGGIRQDLLSAYDEKSLSDLREYLVNGEVDAFHFLGALIEDTESMDNSERDYWADILPSMTTDQIYKLFEILVTEAKRLRSLELKYQREIRALNEKWAK